jgi:NAD-dependent DNA ligase
MKMNTKDVVKMTVARTANEYVKKLTDADNSYYNNSKSVITDAE